MIATSSPCLKARASVASHSVKRISIIRDGIVLAAWDVKGRLPETEWAGPGGHRVAFDLGEEIPDLADSAYPVKSRNPVALTSLEPNEMVGDGGSEEPKAGPRIGTLRIGDCEMQVKADGPVHLVVPEGTPVTIRTRR